VATTAAKAPLRRIPSRAMFTTPERSENTPPKEAKDNGVAMRIEAEMISRLIMTRTHLFKK
jgi:hypothetical protein